MDDLRGGTRLMHVEMDALDECIHDAVAAAETREALRVLEDTLYRALCTVVVRLDALETSQ